MKYWKLRTEEFHLSADGSEVDCAGVINVANLDDVKCFVERRYFMRMLHSVLYCLTVATTFGLGINVSSTYGFNFVAAVFYGLTALFTYAMFNAWPGEWPDAVVDRRGHTVYLDSGCTTLGGGIYLN